jgi:hypothetical protein
VDALEPKLLLDASGTMTRRGERVVEDRLLDLDRHPVGVRALGSRKPVDLTLGAVSLDVVADLAGRLAPGPSLALRAFRPRNMPPA